MDWIYLLCRYCVGADIFPSKLEVETQAVQKPESGKETDALRKHGRNGRSCRTHTESAHQQEIGPDVDNAGHKYEVER